MSSNSYARPRENAAGHRSGGKNREFAPFFTLFYISAFVLVLWAVFIFLPREISFMQAIGDKAPVFVELSDAIRDSLTAAWRWVRDCVSSRVINLKTCPLSFYLVLINLVTLIVMKTDKSFAEAGKWRIRERTLFLLCLIGGSLGGWTGIYLFRHKTKHYQFIIGFPCIFFLQALLGVLIWYIRSH